MSLPICTPKDFVSYILIYYVKTFILGTLFIKIFFKGPAPVSLPQSSQMAGFQNSSTSLQENEDDLNDSAIEYEKNKIFIFFFKIILFILFKLAN